MSKSVAEFPRPSWLTYVLFGLVLLLAGFLRLHMLAVSPGWYPDEGTEMEIAANLLGGEQRYYAVGQSTLVTGRMPLFHLVLAVLLRVFGRDMLVLRALTAGYGVLATALLFLLGRHMWGDPLALLAAAMYALFPNAVLYSRFGFIYNQIAALNIVVFFALWRFVNDESAHWLAVACLFAGLSLLTGISAVPILLYVVLAVALKRARSLTWAIPLLLLLPATYALVMCVSVPHAFFSDLHYLFLGRVGTGVLRKVAVSIWNYQGILSWDVWFPLAAFGLTRIGGRREMLFTCGYFWFMLFSTVTSVPSVTNLGFHYLIPVLPWVAVGMAAFLQWTVPKLLKCLEEVFDAVFARLGGARSEGKRGRPVARRLRTLLVSLATFWILLSPFILMPLVEGMFPGLASPEVEKVTIRDVADARAAAGFVNSNVHPAEVVLAPPHVGWLIDANVADFQQATAYQGGETQNYPIRMDGQRFLFDCSPESTAYAVWWTGWRDWESRVMPDVGRTMAQVAKWPVVYQQGEWTVFENPAHVGSASPAKGDVE